MTKQDYLEIILLHTNANKKIHSELDVFEILASSDVQETIERNNQAIKNATHILKTYFKTFSEEIEQHLGA